MADICAEVAASILCGGGETELQNVLFIDPSGDNSTAEKGNINQPWADPWAAALTAVPGDTLFMFNGNYDGTGIDQVLATVDNLTIVGNGSTISNHWMIAGQDDNIKTFKILGLNSFAPRFTPFRPRGGFLNWNIDMQSMIFNPAGPTYYTLCEDNGSTTPDGLGASYGSVYIKIDYIEGGFYLHASQTTLDNTEPLNITYQIGSIYKVPPSTNPQSRGFLLLFDCQLLNMQMNIGTAFMRQVVWGLSYFGQSNSNNNIIDLNIGTLDYFQYDGFGHRGGLFFAEYGGVSKETVKYNITISEGNIENIYLFGGSAWLGGQVTFRESRINFIDPGNSGQSNFGLLNLSAPGIDLSFLNCVISCDEKFVLDQSIPNNSTLKIANSEFELIANDDMFSLISNTGAIQARYSTFILQDPNQSIEVCTVVRNDEYTLCTTNSITYLGPNISNSPLNVVLPINQLTQKAQIKMTGGTALSTPGTPVPMNATTTGTIIDIINPTSEFSTNALNPDITYTGVRSKLAEITINLSSVTTATETGFFYIAINGNIIANSVIGRIQSNSLDQSVSLTYETLLNTGDVIEIYIDTTSARTLTIRQAFLKAEIIN